MRIMYVIKSFAMKAGVERVISDKMNFLVKNGYEVSFVTYEQGNHPYAFPIDSSIRHISLDARFFTLNRYPIWKRLIVRHQMRTNFKIGLQQAVDEISPDIIITTTYSMKVLDIILGLHTSAHRLIESHIACYTIRKTYDCRSNFFMRLLAEFYDRRAFMRICRFDKLIVLTKGDLEEWKRYMNNVVIIPNPVTIYPNTISKHEVLFHRIIAVGRLHEQKGFDMLIDAFALISDRCPKWHVDIIGSGDDYQSLWDRINIKGLAGRINIIPPTDQIYLEYLKSDFYVLSSRYEGYPLVLNEAMSCEIPCVAFRCKYGPEDAIQHRVDGLLARNGDVEDLAQQILWMIEHPKEMIEMGRAARIKAKSYLPEVIMSRWDSLFLSVVKQ